MKRCPRCGEEFAGKGKTGLCQPCASHFTWRTYVDRVRNNGHKAWRSAQVQPETMQEKSAARSRRPEPSMPKFKCLEGLE